MRGSGTKKKAKIESGGGVHLRGPEFSRNRNQDIQKTNGKTDGREKREENGSKELGRGTSMGRKKDDK